MSIGSGDIVCYGSQYMRASGVGIQGGAIDTTTLVYFNNSSLVNNINYYVKITCTALDLVYKAYLYGRNVNGIPVSGYYHIFGTSGVVVNNVTFDTIEKFTGSHIDSPGNSSIWVYKATNPHELLFTVSSGISTVVRPFYNISGGYDYYEKVFVKNNNQSESLLNVGFSDNGGDPNNYITFALENQLNASGYIANRNTAPNPSILGNSGFSASSKSMYNEIGIRDLQPGEAIGLWFKISLPENAGPENSIWSLKINGDN